MMFVVGRIIVGAGLPHECDGELREYRSWVKEYPPDT
jgi:hypothetical protein